MAVKRNGPQRDWNDTPPGQARAALQAAVQDALPALLKRLGERAYTIPGLLLGELRRQDWTAIRKAFPSSANFQNELEWALNAALRETGRANGKKTRPNSAVLAAAISAALPMVLSYLGSSLQAFKAKNREAQRIQVTAILRKVRKTSLAFRLVPDRMFTDPRLLDPIIAAVVAHGDAGIRAGGEAAAGALKRKNSANFIPGDRVTPTKMTSPFFGRTLVVRESTQYGRVVTAAAASGVSAEFKATDLRRAARTNPAQIGAKVETPSHGEGTIVRRRPGGMVDVRVGNGQVVRVSVTRLVPGRSVERDDDEMWSAYARKNGVRKPGRGTRKAPQRWSVFAGGERLAGGFEERALAEAAFSSSSAAYAAQGKPLSYRME